MKCTVFYAKDQKFLMPSVPAKLDRVAFTKVAEIDAATLGEVFRKMNVVDGTELPVQLKVRSMSVGDVVVADGVAHVCCPIGWEKVDFA